MRKTAGMQLILIILSQLYALPFWVPEARAETRVTITFAAGGMACGVYLFLMMSFRSSMTMERFEDGIALVSRDPEGWHIVPPTLNIIREESYSRLFPADSPERLQMNLLQFRF